MFVNPKSGDGTTVRAALADRARERGIEVTVLGADQRLAALVGEAVAGGADALGMAGGDGSLAVVAAAAHAHDLPFVCIPAGTRNHFALDLGIDANDPVGALDAFTDGVERVIDMGRVNGRLFLNNVSLGIYGEAVRQPTYRDAKVRTLLETTHEVLGPSSAARELRLVDDLGQEHRDPRLSSSRTIPTRSTARRCGARPTLDSGRLGVVVLDEPDTSEAPWRAWTATSRGACAGADGARGYRRRGGRSEPAARVRGRACCAAREDPGWAFGFAPAAQIDVASANAQARRRQALDRPSREVFQPRPW